MSDIMEYYSRTTQKVEFYYVDANIGTMLGVVDPNRV